MVWKKGFFYYKSIQDCRSYDLQNLKLKMHNFSLELKQSKTPPALSYWIISTLVRHYVFFNPRLCKSWDCPIIYCKIRYLCGLQNLPIYIAHNSNLFSIFYLFMNMVADGLAEFRVSVIYFLPIAYFK